MIKRVVGLTICVGFILLAASPAEADWLPGWDQRIRLTIDSSKVDANLSDFPVLVYLSAASGIGDVDVSCVFDELTADANRKKIAVTKSDGLSQCYVEIEKWDDANEKAWLWVKVFGENSVSSSSDTVLYLYYDSDHADNTTYVGDTNSTPAENVWDGSFKVVYHMDDNTTSSILDSTSNNNDGTKGSANNPQVITSGQIGNAQDFSSDTITINPVLNAKNGMCIEFWLKADSLPFSGHQGIIAFGDDGQRVPWVWGVDAASSISLYMETNAGVNDLILGSTASTSWENFAFNWNGDTGTPFSNGTSGSTDTTSGSTIATSDGYNYLGYINGYAYLDGKLDEVRISDISRSAAWIKASYNSGNDSLITFEGEANPPDLTISSGGQLTFNSSSTLDINGDVILAGTLASDSSATNIYTAGDWTSTGTFTCGTSTVTIDGTRGRTITSGGSNWSHLVVTLTNDTASFADGFITEKFTAATAGSSLKFKTWEQAKITGTDDNSLTLTGTSGNEITLDRYDGSGTDKWEIYPSGTTTWSVSYVNVSNSANLNSTYINPSDSTDGGNTLNWFTPTLVKLTLFKALGLFGKVEVIWETASEVNSAGYNIYRKRVSTDPGENTEYIKINRALIPGLGDSTTGKSYSYIDYNVLNGEIYYYKLEAVEYNGSSRFYGPVMARPGQDSDGDGMTDDWEQFYGLDPYTSDSSLDPDNDGLTNLEEFLAGTSPLRDERTNTQTDEGAFEGVKILSLDADGIILELYTRRFEVEEKTVGEDTYQRITLPGYIHGETNEENRPLVPIKGVLLAVPQRASLSLEILETEPFSYSGYLLAPAIGEELIVEDSLYPEAVADINSISRLRSQRVAQIIFSPIQYNSAIQEVTLNKRIKVKLKFTYQEGGEEIVTDETLDEFQDIVGNLVANYSNAAEWQGFPEGWSGMLNPEASFAQMAAKISVKEDGIYRLTGADLEAAGIDLSQINPLELKLYQSGEETAIRVVSADSLSFSSSDYVEFYGEKKETKYTDTNVYWLVNTDGQGLRMEENSVQMGLGAPLYSFGAIHHEETNSLYWGEQPGDNEQERWLWQKYFWGGSGGEISFNLANIDVENLDNPAQIEIVLWGFFDVEPHPNHHVYLYLNDHLLIETTWDGRAVQTLTIDFPQSYLNEGTNTVTILPVLDTGCAYDLILVDYFDIKYWKKFMAEEDECAFTNSEAEATIQISNFSQPEVKLYDISNSLSPVYLGAPSLVEVEGANHTFNFAADFSQGLALTEDKIKEAAAIEENEPSSLQVIFQQADYLFITPEAFYEEILPLAELRAAQGLAVKVVKLEDIYDEFNFGIASPHAIKDFLTFTYKYWLKPAPTYVLLVGDATYDYKYYWGRGDKNILPSYLMVTPYLGETASDNWFVCLDGEDDLLPDMFLGRFSVKTEEELTQAVNKIFSYEAAAFTGWEKRVVFVADNDETVFEETNDLLQSILPADYETAKVYLSQYETPAACTEDIIEQFDKGSLILNYVGHGSIDIWAAEYIFQSYHLESINNLGKYPFVITMNCLNGFFIQPFGDCLAEAMFLPAEKGAIACWSPTGMGEPQGHRVLNQGLFQAVFEDYHRSLGAATTQAKIKLFAETGNIYEDLIQTYCLFGDPALELPISQPALGDISTTVVNAPEDESEEEDAGSSSPAENEEETTSKKKVKSLLEIVEEKLRYIRSIQIKPTLDAKKAASQLLQRVAEKLNQIKSLQEKITNPDISVDRIARAIREFDEQNKTHFLSAISGEAKRAGEISAPAVRIDEIVKPKPAVIEESEEKEEISEEETEDSLNSLRQPRKKKATKKGKTSLAPKSGMTRLLESLGKKMESLSDSKEAGKAELASYVNKLKEKYEKMMEKEVKGISAAEVMDKVIRENRDLKKNLEKQLEMAEENFEKLPYAVRKAVRKLMEKITLIFNKLFLAAR